MLDYINSSITENPSIVLGLMIVLIILVFFLSYRYVACRGLDSMRGNFATGGNMPMWQYGSHDAGAGGSMHRTMDVANGDTMALASSTTGFDSPSERYMRGHYGSHMNPHMSRPNMTRGKKYPRKL